MDIFTTLMNMIVYLDYFGTAVFALSGVLVAGRLNMDFFGAIVLAIVAAVGGGTLRDLILGTPPVWTKDMVYIYVILATCFASYFYINSRQRIRMKAVEIADAVGLAVFTAIGAQKTIEFGFGDEIAVVMGVMTAVAGGMIRDTLANQVPVVLLGRQFYATACLFGALVFVWVLPHTSTEAAIWLSFIVTLSLRLAAIKWNLSIPLFPKGDENNS